MDLAELDPRGDAGSDAGGDPLPHDTGGPAPEIDDTDQDTDDDVDDDGRGDDADESMDDASADDQGVPVLSGYLPPPVMPTHYLPPLVLPGQIHYVHAHAHDVQMGDSEGGGVPLGGLAHVPYAPPSSFMHHFSQAPYPPTHSGLSYGVIGFDDEEDDDHGDGDEDGTGQSLAPNGFGSYHISPQFPHHPPPWHQEDDEDNEPPAPGPTSDIWAPTPSIPVAADGGPSVLYVPFPALPALPALDPDDPDLLPGLLGYQPAAIVNSRNPGMVDFLRHWTRRGQYGRATAPVPKLTAIHKQACRPNLPVCYDDLAGDSCDIQGWDWASVGTTRKAARTERRRTYSNFVHWRESNNWGPDDRVLKATTSYFRFRRMQFLKDTQLAHFQLRNSLACASRTQAFYPTPRGINQLNLMTKKTELAVNMNDFPVMTNAISTLDANHGVLMGGTSKGQYCLKALDTEDNKAYSEGALSPHRHGISNHIQIYTPRQSGGPVAGVANNDRCVRVMDLTTETILAETQYSFEVNSAAVSPDRRLRVLVGDNSDVLVACADTGEVLQELSGHRDYGFACAWSDNGWTVATGFQEKTIRIWDARRWCDSSGFGTPVCSIRSEMAGVRNLRFSPLGSGPPLLVATEEADYISIIDARTFEAKQTVDVFSEIGGVAFTDDGQDLNVLCCDRHRGGLLQLERRGRAPQRFTEQSPPRRPVVTRRPSSGPGFLVEEWPPEPEAPPPSRHRRRPALLERIDPF